MRKINLIGKRFGRLVVLKENPVRKNKRICWDCICDCDNQITVEGTSLKSGTTKSCGCLRTESNHKKAIDLIGQKIGRLTALEQLPERQNEHIVWKCRCDCGNIINVQGYSLKTGNTTSCGCYKSDKLREINTIDMTGLRFGKLLVLE